MAGVVIATVDATASDAIREALEEAGIAVNVVAIRPFKQLEYLRHQHRSLVDIEVPEEHAAAARGLLAHFSEEAEQAARAQAEASGTSARSDEELAREAAARLDPKRSKMIGFWISLLLPVAGPIYAGSTRLTLVSLVLHTAAFAIGIASAGDSGWYRSDLHSQLGWMVLGVARFIDVVGTLETISARDRGLDDGARPPGGDGKPDEE